MITTSQFVPDEWAHFWSWKAVWWKQTSTTHDLCALCYPVELFSWNFHSNWQAQLICWLTAGVEIMFAVSTSKETNGVSTSLFDVIRFSSTGYLSGLHCSNKPLSYKTIDRKFFIENEVHLKVFSLKICFGQTINQQTFPRKIHNPIGWTSLCILDIASWAIALTFDKFSV